MSKDEGLPGFIKEQLSSWKGEIEESEKKEEKERD